MKKSVGAHTIVFPTPTFVVGSYDEQEQPNMLAIAWGGVCSSKPPCVAISLQKQRYSYNNIVRTHAFTVNVPSVSQLKEADYVGIYSGRKENKFEGTGLTPVKSDLVNAPYVKEFPLVLECKVIQTIEIGVHTQFVGEILDVKADEDVLDSNGMPDVDKVKPFMYSPANVGYYAIGEMIGKAFSVGKK